MKRATRMQVAVKRVPYNEPGMKQGALIFFDLSGYHMVVRVPPTSSAAFVDSWSLPTSPGEQRVVDSLLERLIDVTRSEKPRVRVLVRPTELYLLDVFKRKGFSQSADFRQTVELTLNLV